MFTAIRLSVSSSVLPNKNRIAGRRSFAILAHIPDFSATCNAPDHTMKIATSDSDKVTALFAPTVSDDNTAFGSFIANTAQESIKTARKIRFIVELYS